MVLGSFPLCEIHTSAAEMRLEWLSGADHGEHDVKADKDHIARVLAVLRLELDLTEADWETRDLLKQNTLDVWRMVEEVHLHGSTLQSEEDKHEWDDSTTVSGGAASDSVDHEGPSSKSNTPSHEMKEERLHTKSSKQKYKAKRTKERQRMKKEAQQRAKGTNGDNAKSLEPPTDSAPSYTPRPPVPRLAKSERWRTPYYRGHKVIGYESKEYRERHMLLAELAALEGKPMPVFRIIAGKIVFPDVESHLKESDGNESGVQDGGEAVPAAGPGE